MSIRTISASSIEQKIRSVGCVFESARLESRSTPRPWYDDPKSVWNGKTPYAVWITNSLGNRTYRVEAIESHLFDKSCECEDIVIILLLGRITARAHREISPPRLLRGGYDTPKSAKITRRWSREIDVGATSMITGTV